MKIEVLIFGREAAALGRDRLTVELPDGQVTCADLRRALAAAVPQLGDRLPQLRLAVNHGFADDRQRLLPQDEVALIGWVSGG